MYLSYSGFKNYESCPANYWHTYINKTAPPEPDNGVNSLYGSIVGNVFESFYADRIWRHKDFLTRLVDLVEPSYRKAISSQRGSRVYDWNDKRSNYPSLDALLTDCRETIPSGVRMIKENSLLGPQAEAEMKLDSKFGPHIVGGRADFVIRRIPPYNDTIILDGKGSRHGLKYVDGKPLKKGKKVEGTQLKWYAMLHKERIGHLPDKLGYLLWKFYERDPEVFVGENALEWVPFEESDISRLKHEVLTAMDRISASTESLEMASGKKRHHELREELFPAQAGDSCRFCSFVTLCEEGTKKMEAMSRKPREKVSLPTLGVTDGLCLEQD